MDDVPGDELKAGTVLLHGQYTIDAFLNSGGFGITYLARDSLGRRIVLKECFPMASSRRSKALVSARSRAHEPEFRSIVKLFVQEAFSLAKLKHPYIVGVHQVFEDNNTAYMALDYVDGSDLGQTVVDGQPRLPPKDIVAILTKLLDALGFVHSQGMLHRDISPENILLSRETGDPVLIDFGAARDTVPATDRALTALRVVKDGYSPQEFYVEGSKHSPSSDLYALGATFWHLIVGEAPANSQSRLLAAATKEPDPLVKLEGRFKGYPPGFLRAIDKAMNVFPADRLQSAQEWLDMIASPAIKVVAPTAGVAATRPVSVGVVAEPIAAPRSRTALILASSAVVALVAISATWLGGFLGGSDEVVEVAAGAQPEAAPAAVIAAADPSSMTAPDQESEAVEAALPKATATPETSTEAAILTPQVEAEPVATPAATGLVLVEREAAEHEVKLEMVAQSVSDDAAVAAPSAVTVPSTSDKLTLARAVRLPFSTNAAQKNLIESTYLDAPVWMKPGQQIVEINGAPVGSSDDLREVIGREIQSGSEADVRVIFGVQASDGSDIVYKTENLSVVSSLILDTGLEFEVRETVAGHQTVVTAVPAGPEMDLKVGDVIVAYTATQQRIDGSTTLAEILMSEIEKKVAKYSFAAQRDGDMITAFFNLTF
jgi:hypothetical protein